MVCSGNTVLTNTHKAVKQKVKLEKRGDDKKQTNKDITCANLQLLCEVEGDDGDKDKEEG